MANNTTTTKKRVGKPQEQLAWEKAVHDFVAWKVSKANKNIDQLISSIDNLDELERIFKKVYTRIELIKHPRAKRTKKAKKA